MTKRPKKVAKPPVKAALVGTPALSGPSGDPIITANLRRLMEAKNLPASGLARLIGISPQAVSLWFGLQTAPTARRLNQIANVFGVTVEQLRRDSADGFVRDLKQLDMSLIIDPQGDPRLDRSAITGRWQVPGDVVDVHAAPSDAAVLVVKDDGLEPDLRVGDYVFADIACRAVVVPGIYLLLIAGAPAWRQCHPLFADKVYVADRVIKQEVAAQELSVLARAIRLLVRPSRSLM